MLLLAGSAPARAQRANRSPTPSSPSAAAAVPAETVTLAPLAFEAHRLANGLQVVTLENHRAPVINLQVWYHVGSKDERPGRTDFAYLLEHLMFMGSEHLAANQHSRLIEEMGGVENAYVNDDVSVYWETFPSRYLERVMWMEADRMGGLDISQANFAAEREIVKEERQERVDNPPYGRITEDLYAAAFTLHPYHHMTISPTADLDKATLDDVRDFYHTYYRPDNATLVIVGDFSTPDVLDWARKYFGGMAASPTPIPRITVKEPPQTAVRRITRSYANSPLPAAIEAFKIPPRFSPAQYPLMLASTILSRDRNGILYRSLVETQRVALQTFAGANFAEDPNLFLIGAVLNPGIAPSDGEKVIDGVVEELRTKPVDPADLLMAKNQTIVQFLRSRETARSMADEIGAAAVIGGHPALVNEDLDRYLRVSAADIESAANEYFSKQNATVLLVQPPQAPAAPPQP